MIMTEKMFIIAGVFLLGYCLGYYSFEFMRYKNFEQKIDDCEVSFYVSERSMSICCESLTMTETIAKKLLK